MTREEAINRLIRLTCECELDDASALDMAIEALRNGYDRCRDCKWMSDEKHSIGFRCIAPGKPWKSTTAMFKYPSAKACKGFFERKEG